MLFKYIIKPHDTSVGIPSFVFRTAGWNSVCIRNVLLPCSSTKVFLVRVSLYASVQTSTSQVATVRFWCTVHPTPALNFNLSQLISFLKTTPNNLSILCAFSINHPIKIPRPLLKATTSNHSNAFLFMLVLSLGRAGEAKEPTKKMRSTSPSTQHNFTSPKIFPLVYPSTIFTFINSKFSFGL